MNQELRQLIATQYNFTILDVDSLGRKSLKVTTDKGVFAAKTIVKSDQAHLQIKQHIAVFDYLAKHNFPAISLHRTPDNQKFVSGPHHYAFLYQYLPGSHPVANRQFFRQLGELLARLHQLPLRRYPYTSEYHPHKQVPRLLATLNQYQSGLDQQYAQKIIDTLCQRQLPTNLPQAFIHSDPYYYNLVRDKSGVLHFIDLDHSGPAPAIIDIGFVLSHMCFIAPDLGKQIYWQVEGAGNIWDSRRARQYTHDFLYSYQQIRPLSALEIEYLPHATLLTSVRHIQGPAGNLNQEYYRRFLLLQHKLPRLLPQHNWHTSDQKVEV